MISNIVHTFIQSYDHMLHCRDDMNIPLCWACYAGRPNGRLQQGCHYIGYFAKVLHLVTRDITVTLYISCVASVRQTPTQTYIRTNTQQADPDTEKFIAMNGL